MRTRIYAASHKQKAISVALTHEFTVLSLFFDGFACEKLPHTYIRQDFRIMTVMKFIVSKPTSYPFRDGPTSTTGLMEGTTS